MAQSIALYRRKISAQNLLGKLRAIPDDVPMTDSRYESFLETVKRVKYMWIQVDKVDEYYRAGFASWPEKIEYDRALQMYKDRAAAWPNRASNYSPHRPSNTAKFSTPTDDGEDELEDDDDDDEPPGRPVKKVRIIPTKTSKPPPKEDVHDNEAGRETNDDSPGDDDDDDDDNDDDDDDEPMKATAPKSSRGKSRTSAMLVKQTRRKVSTGGGRPKATSKEKYNPPCDRRVADKQDCIKPPDSRDGGRRTVRRACLYCRKRNQACSKAKGNADAALSDTGTPELIKPPSNSPRKRSRRSAPTSLKSAADSNPAQHTRGQRKDSAAAEEGNARNRFHENARTNARTTTFTFSCFSRSLHDGETWSERYQRVTETYLLPGATAKLKNVTPDECLNITYDLVALGDFVQEQIVRFSVTAAKQDAAAHR